MLYIPLRLYGRLHVVARGVIQSAVVGGVHASLLALQTRFALAQFTVAVGQSFLVALFALLVAHAGNRSSHIHHVVHHLVHTILVGTVGLLAALTLVVQTGLLLTALCFEQFAGAPFVLGTVLALSVCHGGLATLHGPHLLVGEVACALPLQPFYLLGVLQLLPLHLSLVATLILTLLFLGILHGQELLELRIIVFALQIVQPLGIVIVHVAAALLHVKLSIRHTALLVEFAVETTVGILILELLQLQLLTDNEFSLFAFSLQTGTFKFYTVLELHHGQGDTTLVGIDLDVLLHHLQLLFTNQSALANLMESGFALLIGACFTQNPFVAQQQFKLGQFIFVDQIFLTAVAIDGMELSSQFKVGGGFV